MEPTRILSSEHRDIEIVLDCLERINQEALQNRKLDRQSAEDAVDFIRNFADGCHHGKEETHLFEELTRKGLPREGGPVGQMLLEHDQGRAFVRGMAENTEAAASGDSNALLEFSKNATGYVQLLRAHILKEDGVLFPMADRVLDEEDEKKLMEAFEQTETEHMGKGTHEKYLKLAEKLADKYGVSKDAIHAGGCGCGHK